MNLPDLRDIDTLLLDMDGTLLDLRFDNYFWVDHLPERYSDIHDCRNDHAEQHVEAALSRAEGTMQWYCTDHWSQHFSLDIMSLKQEVVHLIDYRAGARKFLDSLTRMHHLDVFIVTDAHPDVLALKQSVTGLQQYVQATYCSHDFQAPKRHPDFWQRFSACLDFDPARTLMIDDSPAVLEQSAEFGIGHQLCVAQPDSGRQQTHDHDFRLIDNLMHLIEQQP